MEATEPVSSSSVNTRPTKRSYCLVSSFRSRNCWPLRTGGFDTSFGPRRLSYESIDSGHSKKAEDAKQRGSRVWRSSMSSLFRRRSQESGDLVVHYVWRDRADPSLAIRCEEQARVPPTPKGGARV